jgi:hypothetical protein
MIRNALFASMTALGVALFVLMERLSFLAPFRKTLFLHCSGSIALFTGVLGLNLFAAAFAINRKFFLKDTGKKLAHLDKHLQVSDSETIPPFLEESR